MIKICYVLLTLATGEPTMVNFNEVLAVNQGQNSVFGQTENKIYFKGGNTFGNSSISVKETAEAIAKKVEQCTAPRSDLPFVYVIE